MLPRWSRISLRILAGLFLLVLLLWLGLAAYVNLNKKELLTTITDQLNESINGTLTIESMEPTLVQGFPGISLTLRNVLLRDTMYRVHRHDLLRAKEVSITINAFSVLKGSPRIRTIRVRDGHFFLFTDSTGYSNSNLFITRAERNASGKKTPPKLNHFSFRNVHFVFENKTAGKYFNFDIARLEGKVDYKDTGWSARVKLDTKVGALDFNTDRGPFLKDKNVSADLVLNYNERLKLLRIPMRELEIEEDEISIGGTVDMLQQPTAFRVEIAAEGIDYERGRSLLSRHLQGKLGIVSVKEPVDVQVAISGTSGKGVLPLVRVAFQAEDNTLVAPGAEITDCTFSGYFFNGVRPGERYTDVNSVIAVDRFKGKWQEIPFKADSLRIDNLISPVLSGRFTSDFDLAQLNPVLDNRSFHFDKGKASLDLRYKGGIRNNDTTQPYIIGKVQLKDAGITYVPRNLAFTNSAVTLDFRGSDLFVTNVRLQHGANVLNMDGSLRNFLNLYYTDPAKILLHWRIRSPQIRLEPYRNFFARRSRTAAPAPKATKARNISRMSHQLDEVLERSSVRMQLEVGQIGYKTFNARNLNADVTLSEAGLQLHGVALQHAGGQIRLSGRMDQSGKLNRFGINAQVDGVRVDEFFAAFRNFGQATVTDKNVKGQFYAKADVSGSITDAGEMVARSMEGTVDFELKNGVLMEFAPLKNIGKYVFRRRNLSYIRITSLKDRLEIRGDQIVIHPLQLASDAINADVAGIYALGRGTDINIDVPLRNPKKDELILDEAEKEAQRNKGIVIHLNVSDKEDGKMKIKLVGKGK